MSEATNTRNQSWDHAGIAGMFLGCAAVANLCFNWGMHHTVNLLVLTAATVSLSLALFGYFRLENEWKFRRKHYESTLDVGFDRVAYNMFGPFIGAGGIGIGMLIPAPAYFNVTMTLLQFLGLSLFLLLLAMALTSQLAKLGFKPGPTEADRT